MTGVVMTIRPEHVRQIAAGSKRVELRRSIPKRRFERVAVYESAPTSAVVGSFDVDLVTTDHPLNLWPLVQEEWPASEKMDVLEYFSGSQRGHAIHIRSWNGFQTPVDLAELYDGAPPQNFRYLTPEMEDFLWRQPIGHTWELQPSDLSTV